MVYAYDYSVQSGQISNRRDFLKLPPEAGLPDGLTVDSEGFIWVARWFGGGISRFAPDGKLERTIDFPVGQTSSVMFGGKDLNEIYVTSASVLWESHLAPPGHSYNPPRGGPTFRIIQDIKADRKISPASEHSLSATVVGLTGIEKSSSEDKKMPTATGLAPWKTSPGVASRSLNGETRY